VQTIGGEKQIGAADFYKVPGSLQAALSQLYQFPFTRRISCHEPDKKDFA
jgi:hypothetical protein